MIQTFEKNEAVSPHTITSTGCRAVISNCNDYPVINQIVRIEARDNRGNVIFSIEGKDIRISVEREELDYHY
jgi:hypothetical protein